MIKIKNLSKYYTFGKGQKIEVLKDINLNLGQGKTASITGVSGSGKTTLLSLIAGLDSVSSGTININNSEISSMQEQELTVFRAMNLGFIFQNFYLLPHLTVIENVCLPLEIMGTKNSIKRASYILERLGLAERMHQIPSKLSGGECQRVAIGRAIVSQPTLILADEPTGNLDIDTGKKIVSLLFELIEEHNLTMILVTHNQELAKQCDKQFQLTQGKLQ